MIPPKINILPVDWYLHKEWHLVDTRYDKPDTSFLAFAYLAYISILLV